MTLSVFRVTGLIAPFVLAACATEMPPPPPPALFPQVQEARPPTEALRASFGKVAVTSIASAPNGDVSRPVLKVDVGEAAARGAGEGALGVLGAPFHGGGGGGASGGEALVLWFILLPVLVPAGAIVGAGFGAANASATANANTIPEKIADDMESTLRRILALHEPQADLRRYVLEHGVGGGKLELIDAGTTGAVDPSAATAYAPLAESGASTVLEVGVSTVGLVGRGGGDPELTLMIDVRARLIRAPDNSELWGQQHMIFTSASRRYSLWKANDGALIQSALNGGLENIAREIDDKVFLEVWPK